MHFFYFDESGCNGRDLDNPESPIFVLGCLIVSDEKWNSTNQAFTEAISDYFGDVPDNFELHAEQLFSPNGDGFFEDHDRARRNNLAIQLLDLLREKSHHTAFFAIDKSRLRDNLPVDLDVREYLDFSAPYLISFDYMLNIAEWYPKARLGASARAMIILDEKDEFRDEIKSIVRTQKYGGPKVRRLTRVVEFSYPISSHSNPMVQLADLICYLIKKYLEIENGYRDYYPPDVKRIYRDFYSRIDDRLIRKIILQYDTRRIAASYYRFIGEISSRPTSRWKTREY